MQVELTLKFDMLESLMFKRWAEYTRYVNFAGLPLAEWREAWNMGLIR